MNAWKLGRFLKDLSFACKLQQFLTLKQTWAQSIPMEINFVQKNPQKQKKPTNDMEFDKKHRNECLHELHHSKMVTFCDI